MKIDIYDNELLMKTDWNTTVRGPKICDATKYTLHRGALTSKEGALYSFYDNANIPYFMRAGEYNLDIQNDRRIVFYAEGMSYPSPVPIKEGEVYRNVFWLAKNSTQNPQTLIDDHICKRAAQKISAIFRMVPQDLHSKLIFSIPELSKNKKDKQEDL